MTKSKRKFVTTLLLTIFLGCIGAHRVYAAKWKEFWINLAIFVVGAILVGVGMLMANTGGPVAAATALTCAGGVFLSAMLIWCLVDLYMLLAHKFVDGEKKLITDLQ